MPPPRSKLSKKPCSKPPTPPAVVQESENPEFDQEKFEIELCWCIQQLQKALKSGKLSEKQVQDHRKALNVLMSHSTPLVRKRQVMRLSFGDYRAKMAEEDKKFSKVNMRIKLQEGKPSSKSIFFRKHVFGNGESFKFNFKEPESVDNISEDMTNVKINNEQKKSDFKFKPSENTFRFNFTKKSVMCTNNFKGCCFFRRSALETPSYTSSKKSYTRASAIIYENRSDIVAIRRANSSWRDDDDRSIEDYLSQVTRSSLDVNVGSLKSVKSDVKHMRKRKKNDDVVLERCLSNTFEDRVSKWVYSCDDDLDADSFYKKNSYELQKTRVQSTNKFLDLITMCFWKCSTGCQEISEIN